MAVKSVCLNTFNAHRFKCVLFYFYIRNKFISPKQANDREPILMETPTSRKMLHYILNEY